MTTIFKITSEVLLNPGKGWVLYGYGWPGSSAESQEPKAMALGSIGYTSCKAKGGKLRLSFTSIGGGLIARGDTLVGFGIAVADGKFMPAEAVIDGNTVVLSAPSVAAPVAARYGYTQFVNPLCNLYNKEGLPASPFCTDNGVVTSKE